jgi:tRNA (mo5U34)-methyltransferase
MKAEVAEEYANYSRAQLLDLARKYTWVHSIDLGDGFVTAGLWGENPLIEAALNEIDFRGKKVLDIGCWDGKHSFLADSKGAKEVYATDLVSQRDFAGQPTFHLARAALKSKVKYFPSLSVYDVESLEISDFDIVLFMGVYYHLKDPLRALTSLRRVMHDRAVIIVEGAILEEQGCHAKFYYREPFCGDHSNWWVPTVDCLRQWVECSFFEVNKSYGGWGHLLNQRHVLRATAVRRDDPLYSRVPEDLREYNLKRF